MKKKLYIFVCVHLDVSFFEYYDCILIRGDEILLDNMLKQNQHVVLLKNS